MRPIHSPAMLRSSPAGAFSAKVSPARRVIGTHRGIRNSPSQPEFIARWLPPGDYLVFAFDRADRLEYTNRDVLQTLLLASRARGTLTQPADEGDARTNTHRGRCELIARLMCIVALSLATLAQVSPPASSTVVFRMAGVVVDSITGQPLSGAKVSIYVSENPELSSRI